VKDSAAHGFHYMENDGNGLDPATPATAAKFIGHPHNKPYLLIASFNNPHNICEWERGDALPAAGRQPCPARDGNGRAYIVAANHLAQGAEVGGQKPEPNGRMVRSARYK